MTAGMADRVRALAPFQVLESGIDPYVERYIEETIAVSQKPAPSLDEEERARYVEDRFRQVGLSDVRRDDVNNVMGRVPGRTRTAKLAVLAHLDTVFPRGTDLTVNREGSILRGPGIGDNSSAVAALIMLAELLLRSDFTPESDIVFCANAGEEGLGNLLGIREFFAGYASRPDVDLAHVLIYDGGLGMLCHQGITSRRLKVSVRATGGHSWKDFGVTSAIAVLARAIDAIYGITPPDEPRTTYNVGVISGGTSVNTIAQNAEMLVDMRSVCPDTLGWLSREVEDAVARAVVAAETEIEVLGERPGGGIALDHPLVESLLAVGRDLGIEMSPTAASTDANWPLSIGVPAVTVGLTRGDGTHTLEEWVDTAHSPLGLKWALAALLTAVELTSG